jgi:hypothetical protein
MPTNFIAVPGTNTTYAMFQATLPAAYADNSALWDRRFAYNMRAAKTQCTCRWTYEQPAGWWPARRGMGFYSDPAAPVSPWAAVDKASQSGDWEPLSGHGSGMQHTKFILGRCIDEAGNGVSGAELHGFRTTDDALVMETTADANGYYELGTPNPGAEHYIVAYRAGSPSIVGATVNTLVPTNRDGT